MTSTLVVFTTTASERLTKPGITMKTSIEQAHSRVCCLTDIICSSPTVVGF